MRGAPMAAAASVRAARRRASTAAAAAPPSRVDVGGLLQGAGLARRGRALEELRRALLEGGPGYFYAAGVESLLGETARVYELSRALHALPASVKRRFIDGGSSAQGAAYSGSDVGQTELAYDPATKATARSWDYSRVRFRGEGRSGGGSGGVGAAGGAAGGGASRASAPELAALSFEPVLDGLYERQNVVGAALLGALAEALAVAPSTFEAAFSSGDMGTIRLIHYPGDEELGAADAGADCGISPHTDFEAFTLMHQDAPGLQVLPRNAHGGGGGGSEGSSASAAGWHDAPVGGEGSEYIVIIGDVLERYTNGALVATPHRVVRTAHARRSIIRFNAVAPDTVIEPLEAFVTADRPRAYTRCTMRQHMETTIKNLELGLGSWDAATNTSRSARFRYAEE